MTPTPASRIEPIGDTVSSEHIRDHFGSTCQAVHWLVETPLITRGRRGSPDAPARIISADVWDGLISEVPDKQPHHHAQEVMGSRKARKALSPILLSAWFEGTHTTITEMAGAYRVVIVPSWWWDDIPAATHRKIVKRVRSSRPKYP